MKKLILITAMYGICLSVVAQEDDSTRKADYTDLVFRLNESKLKPTETYQFRYMANAILNKTMQDDFFSNKCNYQLYLDTVHPL